jgi:uncharacterized protein (DUF2235 family)
MPKNIVICCDGTGNQYGSENSNVVKLYWTLTPQDKQFAYYHPGVGTMGSRNALSAAGKLWTRVRGLAFGYGFSDNIADVYAFLMAEFHPGDSIYIFGFSRGSYTARALCGLLNMFGLLTPGNEALIPYALRLYKSNDPDKFTIADGFRDTFSIPCTPHFLGLWDTVSSVGWILDPISTPNGHLPYTAKLPGIPVLRHAVSIDERRAFFRQNLIEEPLPPSQDLKQVWFAGVHSDVGGSYPEPESGLSKIALRWLICEAQAAGLKLDSNKIDEVLGGKEPYVRPDPEARKHESLRGFWWLGEIWPKMANYSVAVPGQPKPEWKRGIRLNLGRSRVIPEGAHIHQSVFDRIAKVPSYAPKNLPQNYVIVPENVCELAPRPVAPQIPAVEVAPPLLKRAAVFAVLALVAVFVAMFSVKALNFKRHYLDLPTIERPKDVVWPWQNWTDAQRRKFYHLAQGSELMPYSWFVALEQPGLSSKKDRLFKDTAYLQRFGFIPDSPDGENPDGLPVGFARDDQFVDPYTGQRSIVVGLTCAACHTGELFYGDKAIRIDAGPSLIDLQKFTVALGGAVGLTYYLPWRFNGFARRVLGPNASAADKALLRRSVKYYLDTSKSELIGSFHYYPTVEGYGRTDALARIDNFVFGTELNNDKNLVIGNGPVNFPPIWDASWLDWVQYNGSIQQPMGRNVGEALGVRSRINLLGYPGKQYQNTIRVDNLHEIEKLIGGDAPGAGVLAPAWPADLLGKIDPEKASKGARLYNQLCLHCHQPPILSDEGKKPEHWTTPNAYGKQFFKVTMIPLGEIGTDPNEAENFFHRTAASGPLGMGSITAVEGLRSITKTVIDQAYTQLNLTPGQQSDWNGYRENILRAPLAYKARPHNGVWATPPYLHNGSVPNIYALLSPVSERPKVFYLGSKKYDPVHLGLDTAPFKGGTEFRVNLPGNSNAGHEFNDGPIGNGVIGRELSEDERMQIIEYLKTL